MLWESAWANETIFFLSEGVVKLFIEVERGCALIDFAGPGDILGLSPRDGPKSPLNAVAVGPCRFLILERALWHRHVLETPQLGFNLARISAEYLRRSLFHHQMLREVSVRGRLAHLLLHYGQRFGVPAECGNKTAGLLLPFALCQRELAATIGASRESLQKSLAELRKRGLVSTDDAYRITIHDRAALAKLCALYASCD